MFSLKLLMFTWLLALNWLIHFAFQILLVNNGSTANKLCCLWTHRESIIIMIRFTKPQTNPHFIGCLFCIPCHKQQELLYKDSDTTQIITESWITLILQSRRLTTSRCLKTVSTLRPNFMHHQYWIRSFGVTYSSILIKIWLHNNRKRIHSWKFSL